MRQEEICPSSDIAYNYRKMIKYYHQVPTQVAIFVERVLVNLQFIVRNQEINQHDEVDINEYFNKLKDIYLRHYKGYKKVRIQVVIKERPSGIFSKKIKNQYDLVDLLVYIDGIEYNYKSFLKNY